MLTFWLPIKNFLRQGMKYSIRLEPESPQLQVEESAVSLKGLDKGKVKFTFHPETMDERRAWLILTCERLEVVYPVVANVRDRATYMGDGVMKLSTSCRRVEMFEGRFFLAGAVRGNFCFDGHSFTYL